MGGKTCHCEGDYEVIDCGNPEHYSEAHGKEILKRVQDDDKSSVSLVVFLCGQRNATLKINQFVDMIMFICKVI